MLDLVWGLRWSAKFGAVWLAITVLAWVVDPAGVHSRYGVSFGNMALTEGAGSAAAGLVLGLLRPFLGTAVGAFITGWIVCVPIFGLVTISDGATGGLASEIKWVVFDALVLGGPCGVMLRAQWRRLRPNK